MVYLIGALIGAGIAYFIGASLMGLVGYTVFGAIAAFLGSQKIGAVETFYWIMLLLLIGMIVLVFMGVGVPAFWVFLPVVMMISRFISAWVGGIFARS